MLDGLKHSASCPRYDPPAANKLMLGEDLSPTFIPYFGETNTSYGISNGCGGTPTPKPRGERKRMRGTPRWFNSQNRSPLKQRRLGIEHGGLLTPLPGPNRCRSNYINCFALFIVFELDNLGGCLTEAEDFSKELEGRWGFDTTIYKIPFLDSPEAIQENVENAVCNFINAHDGDDNLLLIHYGGHGSFGSQGGYTLTMEHEERHYEVQFQPIREHLLNCKSDVAIFLDACYAAAGVSRGCDPHTIEILAACDSTATTPAVGWRSFTSCVLRVLHNYSQETLMLKDLCGELKRLNGRPFRKAFYYPLEKSRWGSITLRRSS